VESKGKALGFVVTASTVYEVGDVDVQVLGLTYEVLTANVSFLDGRSWVRAEVEVACAL
jgi:hypothetical protein